jgi:tetratricopeptide (TPR) repeat protein
LVLTLETLFGREQTRLLEAGRERYRGQLFQALLDRARIHLAAGAPENAETSFNLATWVLRYSVNDNARAKGFFAIGMLWHDFGQFDRAIAAYRRSAHHFAHAGNPSEEIRVHARWGQAQAATGRLRAAIRHYHHARRLAEVNNEARVVAQIHNNLGNAYLKAGDFRRAYATFAAAVAQAETLDYPELLCLARGNLGLTAFELGRFKESEAALRAAATLAHELNDHTHETSYIGSLGNALRALGRLNEAEACFRRALDLARQIDDRPSEELALGNLGILLFHMGWMNEAIASLVAAQALGLSLGETLHAAENAYHLGVAYREIGDETASANAFLDCLSLAKTAGHVALQTGALQGLAYWAMNGSKWEEAAVYLQQAEALKTQEPDAYNASSLATAWGYWFYQQEQYDEAVRHFAEAVSLAEKADNRFSLLTAQLNYGGALVMSRRLEEAESILLEALQEAQTIGLPDEARVIWEGLGLVNELRGNTAEARACYEQAVEAVESGRGELTAETHRLSFFGARQGPYLRLAQLLARVGQAADAWAIAEQARGRSFVDALARTPMRVPVTLPAALVAQEQELLATLRLRQEEVAQANSPKLPALLAELAQLRDQLQTLWDEVAVSLPEYVALRRGEPLSWRILQEILAS